MAAPSKAQMLTEVHTLLKRRYKLGPRDGRMSVLEAVIYGICHEGTTREQASQALNRFKDHFFDWNEVRVSSLEEIQQIFAGLPNPEDRAQKVRKFLRKLFEKTYAFNLEALVKKPQKDAVQALQEMEAFGSDFVAATVVQQALAGHAIPVDEPIRRGLVRLGLADEAADVPTLRASIERAVPKNRGNEFFDLMEELTHDTCVEGPPDCPRCELKKICPTGQERIASDKAAAKAAAKATRAEAKAAAAAPAKAKAPAPAQPDHGKAPKGKASRSK
jgi:endonuclease-3